MGARPDERRRQRQLRRALRGATNYYAVAPPASGLLADAVSTNPQLGKVNAQLCALESQRMSVSRGRRVVLQASSAPDAVSD